MNQPKKTTNAELSKTPAATPSHCLQTELLAMMGRPSAAPPGPYYAVEYRRAIDRRSKCLRSLSREAEGGRTGDRRRHLNHDYWHVKDVLTG